MKKYKKKIKKMKMTMTTTTMESLMTKTMMMTTMESQMIKTMMMTTMESQMTKTTTMTMMASQTPRIKSLYPLVPLLFNQNRQQVKPLQQNCDFVIIPYIYLLFLFFLSLLSSYFSILFDVFLFYLPTRRHLFIFSVTYFSVFSSLIDLKNSYWNIYFKIKMSKCEHGEKITTFCASECCVWK